MADGRGYRNGAYALEIDGKIAGYVSKIEGAKVKGDQATINGGPMNRQKKMITKMVWEPIKFDIGMAMGDNLASWMKASFDMQFNRKDGAIIWLDHNYEAQRRLDFQAALITEITIPGLDPKGKTAPHFSVTIQPEQCRYTKGGGKMTPTIAESQKMYVHTNFRVDVPGMDCKHVSKIDSVKWTQKVHEDAIGEFLESQYVPTAVEVGDLKLTIGAQSYEKWYQHALKTLVNGEREEKDEVTIAVDILAADAKTPVATLEFTNSGMKSFGFEASTANEDKAASCVAEFYVEGINFIQHKKN